MTKRNALIAGGVAAAVGAGVAYKTGAAQASEALPMLNAVMAFPTTIYVDKKGRFYIEK